MSARTETLLAGNLHAIARAEAAADAAIHKAIFELLAPVTDMDRWQSNGREYAWSFDELPIMTRIRSETAKIDLNAAPQALLAGLFRAVGVAATEANALADAVLDWRDLDDLRSLHGAEKEDYAAAGKPHGPANRPFESIDELRDVLGISSAIFQAVSNVVTVYSYSSSVDVSVADRPVLLALPGATSEIVDTYIESRRDALEQGRPLPAFPPLPGTGMASGGYYAIRAETIIGDNARFSREAVVRITGNISSPYAILAWNTSRSGTLNNTSHPE